MRLDNISGDNPEQVAAAWMERFYDYGGGTMADIAVIKSESIRVISEQPQTYTETEYLEARRYQQDFTTELSLDYGRESPEKYAALVVKTYEREQHTKNRNTSLVAQAKTIDDIVAILGRL